MAEIHIERKHQLSLGEARLLADRWSEEASKKFDVAFTVLRGETADTYDFARSGVKGSLRVDGERFTLGAKLGLLLGAFKDKIQAEIERNFNELLPPPTSNAP